MRADYLTKFHSLYTGGLKQLATESTNYTNANHYHSNTTTAAGHAAISTGCYPINNGIVANNIYNRAAKRWEYSVLDSSAVFEGIDSCFLKPVSPKNLVKPTLGDIVKEHNKNSKYYSVSLKDRAAIAMGGQNANRAFWFDASSTQMVSITHYQEPFFDWVKDYKANTVIASDIENGWQLSEGFKPVADVVEDSITEEAGIFSPTFPHTVESLSTDRVPVDREGVFIWHSPFGDKYVLEFAKKLITEEELGQDEHTDVLNIGLSAADLIGHHFGPNSWEVQDYYIKLDQYLNEFISFLNTNVGSDNYTLVLTGDHGVVPFPSLNKANGIDAGRITRDQFTDDMLLLDSTVMSKFGLDTPTVLEAGYKGLEPDFDYLHSKGIDSLEYTLAVEELLYALPYVAEVFTPYDLVKQESTKKHFETVKNCFDINKGTFLYLIPKENYLLDARPTGTSHGSPYHYDTNVPLLFFGSGWNASESSEKVKTVDITPTLLEWLNIKTDHKFDGESLL